MQTIIVLAPVAIAVGVWAVRQVRLCILDSRLFSRELNVELTSFDLD